MQLRVYTLASLERLESLRNPPARGRRRIGRSIQALQEIGREDGHRGRPVRPAGAQARARARGCFHHVPGLDPCTSLACTKHTYQAARRD